METKHSSKIRRVLLQNETAQVWKSTAVRIWMGLLGITLLVVIFKFNPVSLPAEATLDVNGETVSPLIFFITMGGYFTLIIPVLYFVPVVAAGFAKRLIEPAHLHFVLSRPISRTQAVVSNIGGVMLGFGAVMTSFIVLIWAVIAIKTAVSPWLLLLAPFITLVLGAIYAFLLTLLLATRSNALALTGTLVYTVFLGGILTIEITGLALPWWMQLLEAIRECLLWILPPVWSVSEVLGALLTAELSAISPQALVATIVSFALFSALSMWLYRRMEF